MAAASVAATADHQGEKIVSFFGYATKRASTSLASWVQLFAHTPFVKNLTNRIIEFYINGCPPYLQ